jgi:diaminopimelate epimerase
VRKGQVAAAAPAMTTLAFTKMQGSATTSSSSTRRASRSSSAPAQIRALADRRFGVGCDQVLVVERPARADVDFRYRIFNADGGEVEQCGNGARCFVKFVRDRGLTAKREIRVETAGGIIAPRLEDGRRGERRHGRAALRRREVPFDGGTGGVTDTLEVDGRALTISALSMGNPHAVQVVADVDAAPVTTEGRASSSIRAFPSASTRATCR